MGKKILTIDDDKRMLDLERILFTRNGFAVVSATNGTEGVSLALGERPDLIVLDIEMPGKDGYATLIELRSHAELKETPVIVLSALTDGAYHKISESLGTVEHLDKPFRPDALLAKVKEVLGA